MKKLVLIPITLITLTPIISMVGCGTKQIQFELTHAYSTDESFYLRSEKKVNLQAGVTYTVLIDAANFNTNLPAYDLCFFVANEAIETFETIYGQLSTTNASVTVDEKQLEQAKTMEELGKNKFFIRNEEGISVLEIGYQSISATSKIQINFALEQDISRCYLIGERLNRE